ncbi:MAG: Uma2 family endonuclease [Roseiflexaceae bacterium]|nr:Uma2 family endonuclease [Roseiflexaceae bacterium]
MADIAESVTEHEPAWEIAHLFPYQGHWSEDEYVAITNATNRLVEFSHGKIEVLPMPTRTHQLILMYLYRLFYASIEAPGFASVFIAALRVRLWQGKIREPDLVVMLAEHRHRQGEAYFDGADLVVEVVSDDDPKRDLVIKREEYAQAGIPEYWIVEPQFETVTVLRLEGAAYAEHGRYGRGTVATSALLADIAVEVSALFDAAR